MFALLGNLNEWLEVLWAWLIGDIDTDDAIAIETLSALFLVVGIALLLF